jgi:hypothetical protein
MVCMRVGWGLEAPVPSIFLWCRVAGHSAGSAYGLATGREHRECIHVRSKARRTEPTGQRGGGCTHCPTVGREVWRKSHTAQGSNWEQGWAGGQREGCQTGVK